MYKIEIDPAHSLISVRLAGFLTAQEVAAMLADLSANLVRHRIQPGYLLMIDATNAAAQSQEVIAAFQRRIADFPKAKRIAIVNTSQLLAMQARRVMTQDYTRVVASITAARKWLLCGEEASLAA